jgi:uncharacterized protein
MPSPSYRIGRSVTGLGLFATKPIKRGAYIATYRGRRITTEESDRREARGAKYMFALNKRWVIDGSPRSNMHVTSTTPVGRMQSPWAAEAGL